MKEQAKFTYSLHGTVFERQTKTIENQDEKQIKPIKNIETASWIKCTC